ncbi:hypothetical protein NBRC116602_06860 [Hyphomicrobiales bacterium 4NK60-0047b]
MTGAVNYLSPIWCVFRKVGADIGYYAIFNKETAHFIAPAFGVNDAGMNESGWLLVASEGLIIDG